MPWGTTGGDIGGGSGLGDGTQGGSPLRRGGLGGGGVSQRGGGVPARTITLSSEVSIVADAVNNSLLVRASPKDYKKILDALKQLDITPLQVLVEATIVEIRLTGNLKYGVQWNLFGLANERLQEQLTLANADDGSVARDLPGLQLGGDRAARSRSGPC